MSHDIEAVASQLREAGYRVTPQRQLILDAVCELGGHVTPEEVYEHVHESAPAVNRATVYRTLAFLSEQGFITATQRGNGRYSYEIAAAEPHHHLVCRQCGDSVQLPHSALHGLFKEIEAEHDFVIDMKHVTFFGLCARCHNE
jgi:Fur family ferric uptake transcriptional regulator